MNLIPRSTSNSLRHFNDDLGQFFAKLFDRSSMFSPTALGPSEGLLKSDWLPAVDVEEQAEQFIISVEVPGIDPKDIEVTTQDGVLTVRGSRTYQETQKDHGIRTTERGYGSFVRSFSLPNNVSIKAIKANAIQGVLHISLPKVEPSKPERIAVNCH